MSKLIFKFYFPLILGLILFSRTLIFIVHSLANKNNSFARKNSAKNALINFDELEVLKLSSLNYVLEYRISLTKVR